MKNLPFFGGMEIYIEMEKSKDPVYHGRWIIKACNNINHEYIILDTFKCYIQAYKYIQDLQKEGFITKPF